MIYVQVDMTMLVNMFFFSFFFVLLCSQEEPENGYVWSTKMQYSILTGVLENFAKHSCLTGSFCFCRDKAGKEKPRRRRGQVDAKKMTGRGCWC